MKQKRTAVEIFAELERVANMLPAPLYWLDKQGVILGANDAAFKGLGIGFARELIIGKEHGDFYPQDVADTLTANNNQVIHTGQIIEFEEKIATPVIGVTKYFTSIRSPLRDDDGAIIGVIGTSIDITDRKEKERLQIENERHETKAQQHAKFQELAESVAHDIQSPLISLQNIVQQTTKIPESDRSIIRDVVSSISYITNNLLHKYKNKDSDYLTLPSNILVFSLLEQVINEKKYQYQGEPFKFVLNIPRNIEPVFIQLNSSNFKRMLSNLLDNAVDALFNTEAPVVTLGLTCDSNLVTISVKDNGSGMGKEVRDKILNNICVTQGKEFGHGIGFRQILETVDAGHGKLNINLGKTNGTEILVDFPRVDAPSWLVQDVVLGSRDMVIILDDDDSIHGVWDRKLAEALSEAPDIQVMHFRTAYMALEHMKKLSKSDLDRLTVLSDYELINDTRITGLDVIKQFKVNQSILVTSHYDNHTVVEQAEASGVKIIPKVIVNNVKIILDKKKTYANAPKASKRLDLVLLEPNIALSTKLLLMFRDKRIEHYKTYNELLESIETYPKNTKICFAYNLGDMNGIGLAIKLHELGYTKLTLFTGDRINQENMPSYLNHINDSFLDFKKYIRGTK
jgi:PAS domain S-box-containing protein